MILEKTGKPFVWTSEFKQVWIADDMGIVAGHDQVAIPMRSGKQAIFDIVEVRPIYEVRTDGKQVQAKVNKQWLWLCTIKPKAYAI